MHANQCAALKNSTVVHPQSAGPLHTKQVLSAREQICVGKSAGTEQSQGLKMLSGA